MVFQYAVVNWAWSSTHHHARSLRNIEDTSSGDTKDISDKCLLGEWLIEEPYALIGHVRFCEGLLRLEPLIAKEYR